MALAAYIAMRARKRFAWGTGWGAQTWAGFRCWLVGHDYPLADPSNAEDVRRCRFGCGWMLVRSGDWPSG